MDNAMAMVITMATNAANSLFNKKKKKKQFFVVYINFRANWPMTEVEG